MRRATVAVFTLLFILTNSTESFSQGFWKPKGKIIIGVNEHFRLEEGEYAEHENLSFSLALVNGKGNHNEISINRLKINDSKFGVGMGYQYKWQWLKMTKLPVTPYVGFFTELRFNSENILDETKLSDYDINLKLGVAPGINASIGKIFIDCALRLEMSSTSYSKQENIDLTVLKNIETLTFGFKNALQLRVGAGFKF